MPANIYRLSDVRAALPGRVKCECSWCGRVFVVWRSRFLRGAKYCSRECFVEVQREVSRLIGGIHSLRVVRSPEELPEMVREYFRWRFKEALEVLGSDSSALAEVLNELFALLIGEEEIESWQPVRVWDGLSH